MIDPCPGHKKKQLDYQSWHAWAERQYARGHRQRLCPTCGLWFFRSEWGRVTTRWADAEVAGDTK